MSPAKGKQATEKSGRVQCLQKQQPPRTQRQHFPFQPQPAWKPWGFRSLGFLPQGQLQSTGLSCLLKTLACVHAVPISSSTQSLLASTPKVTLRSSKGVARLFHYSPGTSPASCFLASFKFPPALWDSQFLMGQGVSAPSKMMDKGPGAAWCQDMAGLLMRNVLKSFLKQ